jgi:hypothetical protein
MNKNNEKYIPRGIYRNPNQQLGEFKQHTDTVLGKLVNQKQPFIFAGDINTDLVKQDTA